MSAYEYPEPEAYPGRRAERIAEGISILSLDLVRPAYPCLDLAPLEPAALQPVLRRAILDNRAEYARDPTVVPDLRRRTIGLVRTGLGDLAASTLDRWIGSTFVAGPEDYRRYTYLRDVSQNERAWPELTIPRRLRTQFAQQLMDRSSRACFDTSYPDEDGELTEWDTEIFTRMRFYEEFRDPYDSVYLTCGWIDFRRALEWFVANSTVAEQSAFCESIGVVGARTKPELVYEFMPLKVLVRRHA